MSPSPAPPANTSAPQKRSFPWHGWLGLAIMLGAEIAIYNGYGLSIPFVSAIWTGYILLIDGLIWVRLGHSLVRDHPRDLFMLILISNLSWILFEVYNFKLKVWQYEFLPDDLLWRVTRFFWAFGTITPALLQTSELLSVYGVFNSLRWPKITLSPVVMAASFAVGLAFAIIPVLLPDSIAPNFIPFVWIAFIFLLEPINMSMRAPSLYRQLQVGRPARIVQLMVGGLICGLLWELWNYQAVSAHEAAWLYFVPDLYHIRIAGVDLKIGEMPIVGFLGYPPFALESYAIYVFFKWAVQGHRIWGDEERADPIDLFR